MGGAEASDGAFFSSPGENKQVEKAVQIGDQNYTAKITP